MATFLNRYDCPCGRTWYSSWSHTCDDRCPSCNTTCSPTSSEEPDDDDDEPCRECGAVPGTSEYGTVGDGFDGLCPSCADAASCAECGEELNDQGACDACWINNEDKE